MIKIFNFQFSIFKYFRSKRAFSLLELLIVVAIIGILVSLAAVSYSQAQKKARDSRRQADLKSLQNALEQYNGANTRYPGGVYPGLDTTYFPAGEPKDPKTAGSYIQTVWSTSAYQLCADLEADGTFTGSNADTCVYSLQ